MKKNDLTSGNIYQRLVTLAFPIMGTSFLQMAYNLVDMIWIGKLGADAVAAIGTAGYFMWFSFSLITLSRVGAEVKVAQTLGAGDIEEANGFTDTSLVFAVFLGLAYGLALALFKGPLVGFFRLGDVMVEGMAQKYLLIVALSMPFSLFNQVISATYNASGESRLPFRANAIGLVMNMVLDPLMIFGAGMGVAGAALATTLSQAFVSVLLIKMLLGSEEPYKGFRLAIRFDGRKLASMLKIAMPVAVQNGLFTIISMFVARIVAEFGTTAIAVQKVGTQVEAISYMTATGFGVALSAMVGQNLGAGRMDRVRGSFKSALMVMGLFGIFTSFLLYALAGPVFKVFITEEPALSMGIVYLQIISFSQLFMCLEITMSGGFNGLGRSVPPALIGIFFNVLRIPGAYFLSHRTPMGLNGIWWAINISSMLKGTVLLLILLILLKGLSLRKGSIEA